MRDDLGRSMEVAWDIHRRVPVCASYFEMYGYDSLFADEGGPQCDLGKLDAAGVRAFGCALANGGVHYFQTGPDELEVAGPPEWACERVRRDFVDALREAERCPRVKVVKTARDLEPTDDGEEIAILPLITCHSYLTSLETLDDFFGLGLRISHPGGNTCTLWCRAWPGYKMRGRRAPVFNDYGRDLVARMNELGIVIDLAHLTDESAQAIIEASTRPVIDGHTSSRAQVPSCRGLSDDTLRMVADSGGVAGVHFADHMFAKEVWGTKYALSEAEPKREPRLWAYNRHLLAAISDPYERARLRKNRDAQQRFYEEHDLPPDPSPPAAAERIATAADLADQVEYLVNVMGIEHVGLGGDVNGIEAHQWPVGLDHVGELPHLTAELLRRGWREDDLDKFLSRNWYRVFGECLPG